VQFNKNELGERKAKYFNYNFFLVNDAIHLLIYCSSYALLTVSKLAFYKLYKIYFYINLFNLVYKIYFLCEMCADKQKFFSCNFYIFSYNFCNSIILVN